MKSLRGRRRAANWERRPDERKKFAEKGIQRKEERNRTVFYILLLPRLVSLSLRFLFLALHPFLFPPSRNLERRTNYLESTGKK